MPTIRYEPTPWKGERPPFLQSAADAQGRLGPVAVARAALDLLEVGPGVCVEFGAGDGRFGSLVDSLLLNEGWRGLVVERAATVFDRAVAAYGGASGTTCLRRRFDYPADSEAIDQLLQQHFPDHDVGFVSLRLFGPEWHALQSLKARPRLLAVVFNPTFPPELEYVQDEGVSVNQGNSLLALRMLADQKGYKLIATAGFHAFFVQSADLDRFGVGDADLRAIWNGGDWQSRLFIGMDGTMHLCGNRRLLWTRLPGFVEIEDADIQALPTNFQRLFW